MCVRTHSGTAIHLTTAAEIPTQSTHLPQKNRKEISPLRTGPLSQFCPPDQKKKTKNLRQANISFKAGRAVLFSLQRQDLLFWSLRQEGHIAAPHQHCRQLSSRLWGPSQSVVYSPENGSDWKHRSRPPKINSINLVPLLEEPLL